ncbi:ferrochelatase [Sinobacterium caligoides]|uniref:Ferrochelatase n=1 Tax=Sinobacterium caligoides TaxID=933926 RepID=A0A3N2DXW6_9GAMM|nr:ferrochelatase [Sinobacterium caligoides]ROS04706.1 ferrochelatase [Sinobacterium caligoides]
MSVSVKKAVLLVNLGSPEQPTKSAVRAFLKPFLFDRRVVEVPRPIWWLIMHGIILPFRPAKVAKAYASVWDGDSPLRVILSQQCAALQARFDADEAPVKVVSAMTYGAPSIASMLDRLNDEGIEQVVVLPLYPQYSATTTAAVTDQLGRYLETKRDITDLRVVKSYYRHPQYIAALANSVEEFWQREGRGDHLLMSFHGIPQANVDKGDPYYQHCDETARKLAERLGLSDEQWTMSFQSRLGKAQWLSPYTVDALTDLARQPVGNLDVICPAFSADCLETLEEMAIENRDHYFAARGEDRVDESYRYIAALNDRADHVELFHDIASKQMLGFID